MSPPDLRYSKRHEWVRVEPDGAAVGITQFAADELGDVVFLELPQTDADLTQFEKLGEIESVKAVSDLYSPVSGRVLERNEQAIGNPQLVNDSPYDSGWLLRVTLSNPSELDNLMAAEEYDGFLASRER